MSSRSQKCAKLQNGNGGGLEGSANGRRPASAQNSWDEEETLLLDPQVTATSMQKGLSRSHYNKLVKLYLIQQLMDSTDTS